jgi:septum site-determining protein MinD
MRLVINRFDKRVFKKLGFYNDLDAVIDAAQTQLIAVVPFDIRISVVMQRGAAGVESGAAFSPFDRLAKRVEGQACPLVLWGML